MSTVLDPYFGIGANFLYSLSVLLIFYGIYLRQQQISGFIKLLNMGIQGYRDIRNMNEYFATSHNLFLSRKSNRISQQFFYTDFMKEINKLDLLESKQDLHKPILQKSLNTDLMNITIQEVNAFFLQDELRYLAISKPKFTSHLYRNKNENKNKNIEYGNRHQWMIMQ